MLAADSSQGWGRPRTRAAGSFLPVPPNTMRWRGNSIFRQTKASALPATFTALPPLLGCPATWSPPARGSTGASHCRSVCGPGCPVLRRDSAAAAELLAQPRRRARLLLRYLCITSRSPAIGPRGRLPAGIGPSERHSCVRLPGALGSPLLPAAGKRPSRGLSRQISS